MIRKRILITSVVLLALMPVVASRLLSHDKMTMYYDDHQAMEQEILRHIPRGSKPREIKHVMERNGFICTKQVGVDFQFSKEESYWPTYEGTIWDVEIHGQKGGTPQIKVWIQPAD